MSYTVTAELYVINADQVLTARQALAELAVLTCQGPGCLQFKVHQDKANPCRFLLWEAFRDEVAFRLHLDESYTKDYFAMGLTEVVRAIKTNSVV